MDFPYTIVFEPPSRSELRALLRMRGHWVAAVIVALTIGLIYLLASVARADAGVAVAVAPLRIGSHPSGAAAWVDGRQRGATPLELDLEPGVHRVLLKRADALDQQYQLNLGPGGGALEPVLWRRQPLVTRLRPALPGARLLEARLLQDGQLGLSMELPPGGEQQAWRLDPTTGALDEVLPGVSGQRLVFASDGRHLAYVGREIGPPVPARSALADAPNAARVVWLIETDPDGGSQTVGWRAPLEDAERLEDVSWSPQADRLLVIASQPLTGGGALSRVWLLDVTGEHADLLSTLPSDVVPGSVAWSPDGTHVAFVAHAGGINALCLLGVDRGFRYVADLDPSFAPPLGAPPVSWSADSQRMLFVAPHQHLPGAAFDWLTPDTRHALYVASADQPLATELADTQVDEVTWREDGQLLGLSRPSPDAPLRIRLMNSSGGDAQDLVDVPLQPATDYAAAWDLGRANLLVMSRASDGTSAYWFIRLGVDAGS